MKPTFSVLINSVPGRFDMVRELYHDLLEQAAHWPDVEILMFMDNKRRSIGEKRNTLLDMARGRFLAYVDDDDKVSPHYLDCIMSVLPRFNPDLVVFPIKCTMDGTDEATVEPSYMVKENEPYKPGTVVRRIPHELLVWRSSIAKSVRFPDTNVGEDFVWGRAAAMLVGGEYRIPEILYHWRYRSDLAECEK